jgi:ribosome modulation factor
MLRNLLGLGMILNTESYQKGHQAALEGRPATDNPYQVSRAHRADWDLGWRIARKLAADSESRSVAIGGEGPSAYEMGRSAAARGLGAAMNPFHFGHPGHDQWRLGWAEGRAARR